MPARPRRAGFPQTRVPNRVALKRRVDAGEWLLVQEVADLFGVSRATVDRLIRDEVIEARDLHGGLRRCNPVAVLAELGRRQR